MLEMLLTETIFAFFLVFSRIGSAFIIVPGLGSAIISPQIRIILAGSFSLLLLPVLQPHLPGPPSNLAGLFSLVLLEIFYGLYMGFIVRITFTAMEAAGTIIASHMGLANAFLFNPQFEQQSTLPSIMLATIATLMFFITGLHAMFFEALVYGYSLFPPGTLPVMGDMADSVARLISDSFILAVQLAAPFMIIGLLFYLGMGLLARLMPQLQIFFIALPAQLMLGSALIAITVSAMTLVWLGYAEAQIGLYLFAPVSGQGG